MTYSRVNLLNFLKDSFALGDVGSADRPSFVAGSADKGVFYQLIYYIQPLTDFAFIGPDVHN